MALISSWRRELRFLRRVIPHRRGRIRKTPRGPRRTRLIRAQRRDRRRAAFLRATIMERSRLNETVAFDGVPVFRGLALMLQDCRDHGWGGRLNSADRREGVAERYGRMSQAFLFAAWVAWSTRRVLLRGFSSSSPPNPANPVGRSTHDLHSDGVAYRGPVGRPLAWWQLGMDADDAERLRAVATSLGYSAFRPYADGREAHHVNLRSNPKRVLKRRGLA